MKKYRMLLPLLLCLALLLTGCGAKSEAPQDAMEESLAYPMEEPMEEEAIPEPEGFGTTSQEVTDDAMTAEEIET